jgi:hypothetical protein
MIVKHFLESITSIVLVVRTNLGRLLRILVGRLNFHSESLLRIIEESSITVFFKVTIPRLTIPTHIGMTSNLILNAESLKFLEGNLEPTMTGVAVESVRTLCHFFSPLIRFVKLLIQKSPEKVKFFFRGFLIKLCYDFLLTNPVTRCNS